MGEMVPALTMTTPLSEMAQPRGIKQMSDQPEKNEQNKRDEITNYVIKKGFNHVQEKTVISHGVQKDIGSEI